MEQQYWGLYLQETKEWARRTDGNIIYYPSPYIAQAHVEAFAREMGLGTEERRTKIRVKQFDSNTHTAAAA